MTLAQDKDHEVRNFDELLWNESGFSPSEDGSFADPLDVPQDPLENLEWYPNLYEDLDFGSILKNDSKFIDTDVEESFETKAKLEQPGKGKTQQNLSSDLSNIQINPNLYEDLDFGSNQKNNSEFIDTDGEENFETKAKFEKPGKEKTHPNLLSALSNMQINPSLYEEDLKFGLNLKNNSQFIDTDGEENLETKSKFQQPGKEKTQQILFADSSNIQINPNSQKKSSFVPKQPRTKKSRRRRILIFGGLWLPSKSGVDYQDSKPNQSNIITEKSCSHCESKHTSQWRAGPLGRNTLCNACGLRYKLGRLLPEYRPAASPTFDVKKHSNFHKKIPQNRGKNIS
ncbi:GATA transcription factor 14-like [Gastrolobium bilobum]|uniref:GATA transcription factor 14-like n=1 Tax=Gastrolobium bilobum TaxID=150636 RepID=UPI002AB19087|nr:GATA transcription factor 14-like [Gastrolobium bilobum]